MSNMSINNPLNKKLLEDLNLIISEIIKCGNYNVNIYDICVNCGHSLTWDQEYYISNFDMEWLKTSGKNYFFETLNNYIKITTQKDYKLVTDLYSELLELFSLQICEF